ncbi:hypothetical protein HKX48_005193 [Thoreauomyces humboldtii]|nr:hypothetical protein HKX48_005193 [Thoreauomyces humboldtii]
MVLTDSPTTERSCPFKGIDVLTTPYKDFGIRPCDSGTAATRKGKAWKLMRDKAEERHIDRVFPELSDLQGDESFCAGHAAAITDLSRSPKRQREVDEFLAKNVASVKPRKRSVGSASKPSPATPLSRSTSPITPLSPRGRPPPASGTPSTAAERAAERRALAAGMASAHAAAPPFPERKLNLRKSVDHMGPRSAVTATARSRSVMGNPIKKSESPSVTEAGSVSSSLNPAKAKATGTSAVPIRRVETRKPLTPAPKPTGGLPKAPGSVAGPSKSSTPATKPAASLRPQPSRDTLRKASPTANAPVVPPAAPPGGGKRSNEGSRVQSIAALFDGGSTSRSSSSTGSTPSVRSPPSSVASPVMRRKTSGVMVGSDLRRPVEPAAATEGGVVALDGLQARVAELETALAEQTTETRRAQSALDEAQRQLAVPFPVQLPEALIPSVAARLDEVHEHESQITALRESIEALKADAETAEANSVQARKELAESHVNRTELVDQLASSKSAATSFSEKTKKQEAQIAGLLQTVADLTKASEAATTELQDAKQKLIDSQSHKDELARKLDGIQADLAKRITQTAEVARAASAKAASQRDASSADTRKEIERKDAEIAHLEAQISKHHEESAYHIHQIEEQTALHRREWERDLNDARAELNTKTQQVITLKAQLHSFMSPDDAKQLAVSRDEYKAGMETLERAFCDLKLRNQELETALSKKAATHAPSTSANGVTQKQETAKQDSSGSQSVSLLRTELALVKAEQEQWRDSRTGLHQELEEARKRVIELGATVVEKDHLIRDLKHQMDRWNASQANSQQTASFVPERSVPFGSGNTAKNRIFSRSSPAAAAVETSHWVLPAPSPSVHEPLLDRAPPDRTSKMGYFTARDGPTLADSPRDSPAIQYSEQELISPLPVTGGSAGAFLPSLEILQMSRYPEGPHPLRPNNLRPVIMPPPRATSAPPPEEIQRPALSSKQSYDTLRARITTPADDLLAADPLINADFTAADAFLTNSQRTSLDHGHFLDLSRKALTDFKPTPNFNLFVLTHLYLDHNNLAAFPESICEMRRLVVLNLKENKITRVPEGVEALGDLRELHLGHNCIVEVAESLGNLRKLEVLDLSSNNLSKLPFGLFRNSESLECLDLTHNGLRTLPPSLGLLSKTLKGLFIADNPLDPAFFSGGTEVLLTLNVDAAKAAAESDLQTPVDRAADAEKMLRRIHSLARQQNRMSYASVMSAESTGSFEDMEREDAAVGAAAAIAAAASSMTKARFDSFDSGVGMKSPGADTFDAESTSIGLPSSDELSPPFWSAKYVLPADIGSTLGLSASLIKDYARPNRLHCEGVAGLALQRFLTFLRDVHDLDPMSGNTSASETTQPYHAESPVNADAQDLNGRATVTNPERRKHIIAELLATERTYVRELQNVVDVYMTKLNKEQWLGSREVDTIFGNLTSILMIHKDHLLPDMIKTGRSTPQLIGPLFVSIAPYLKMYSQYYNNFDASSSYIAQLEAGGSSSNSSSLPFTPPSLARSSTSSSISSTSSTSSTNIVTPFTLKKPILKKLRNFLKQAREHPQHTQISLQAFLILPVQRLPRYKLLLEQLLGSTGEEHPDHAPLLAAVVEIRKRVSECNENKRAAEFRERAMAIVSRIRSGDGDGVYGADRVRKFPGSRRFVREGRVTVVKVVERVGGQVNSPAAAETGRTITSTLRSSSAWGSTPTSNVRPQQLPGQTPTGVVELLFTGDQPIPDGNEPVGKDFYWFLFSDILCWCALDADSPGGQLQLQQPQYDLIRAFEVFGADMVPGVLRVRGDGCILYIRADDLAGWWTSINSGR